MIVPSIDLLNGQAVQLVGGEKMAINAGDPRPLAERFALVGEIAVIDLDAALGQGSNAGVIRELTQQYACRVGGGIRDYRSAMSWLDAGAEKIILGTAARAELLSRLPRERVIAALDARHGQVVVEGWRQGTGVRIEKRLAELAGLVGGFLVTFVEREGKMQGIDLDRVQAVVQAAGGTAVTVAGGVTTTEEIAAIDRLGADAQVGMALYSGVLDLAEALVAPLRSDRADGLWPTVVTDQANQALGLVYSDLESVRVALDKRCGAYHSRSRGLWIKGQTSGQTQELVRIDLDCDRDALRFCVRQQGSGFCHKGTRTCFGPEQMRDRERPGPGSEEV
jgi:phosphoribosylformimino-5-aminoimidazole carboxamide ribonucleotide (ProFAR) isomerase/phosphoribosyl-AMP cyclohydrolase